MASPSKLPTFQENAAEQNPLAMETSTYPDPVSPPQFDSIYALFNMEKGDVEEDSLTLEKRKRAREGDSFTDEAPRAQCRRSTRTPRIGSGFHNNPEDPVLIGDEVGALQSGGKIGRAHV